MDLTVLRVSLIRSLRVKDRTCALDLSLASGLFGRVGALWIGIMGGCCLGCCLGGCQLCFGNQGSVFVVRRLVRLPLVFVVCVEV